MDLEKILHLGWGLQFIKRAAIGKYFVKNEAYIFDNLKGIEQNLNNLNINGDIVARVTRMIKKLEKYELDTKLLDKDASEIEKMVEIIFAQSQKELRDITIFESVKDCVLDKQCLVQLMNGVKSSFFDEGIWGVLSDIAKSDFSDAAKCLLMGASTPATMITLRASEDVVRRYYENKTGNDFSEKVWGGITKELKKISDINMDLIEHLDYIRKTRRNLAQHPDKIYNQREAERIFMEIISSTHDIYADMK